MGTPASSIGARHTKASRTAILEASLAPIGGRYRTPPVVLAGLGGVSVFAGRPHSATQHPPDVLPQRPVHSPASDWASHHAARLQLISSCSGTSPAVTRRAVTAGSSSDGRTVVRARGPAGRGRARSPDHRGHRLPRGSRRRHRRRADAAAAAPRARGRPARPATSRCARAGARPGLHPPGVGQRLGSGRTHADAGVASHAYEVLAALRRPHRDHALARRAGTDRAAGAAGASELRRDRRRPTAPRQRAADRGGSRDLPDDPARRLRDRPQAGGWLRRLRVGHGREGSTWYLDDGSPGRHARPSLSRFRTTQYPPDLALEEWPTPETAIDGRHRLHRHRPPDGPRRLRPPRPRQLRPHGHRRAARPPRADRQRTRRSPPPSPAPRPTERCGASPTTVSCTARRDLDPGAPRPGGLRQQPSGGRYGPGRPARTGLGADRPATAQRASRPGAGRCTRPSERRTGRRWSGSRSTAARPW